mmetsp:Transcript_8863/g.17314  ORF Transcript_8863/g.17314 Transcript_8863/m.17314 type:complete len:207 (-) Transcript_8863:8-628(-)
MECSRILKLSHASFSASAGEERAMASSSSWCFKTRRWGSGFSCMCSVRACKSRRNATRNSCASCCVCALESKRLSMCLVLSSLFRRRIGCTAGEGTFGSALPALRASQSPGGTAGDSVAAGPLPMRALRAARLSRGLEESGLAPPAVVDGVLNHCATVANPCWKTFLLSALRLESVPTDAAEVGLLSPSFSARGSRGPLFPSPPQA